MKSINNKQGALELSIGTVVILVLGMSMLILGLVLVRTIFTGAQYNVEQINKNVEAEINKLFDETTGHSIIIYLPNNQADIKKGTSFGIAFGVKNDVKGESTASQFTYLVKAASIQEGCQGLDLATADKYIILRRTGTFSMLPGAKPYLNTVKIQPPESAPLCEIGYELQVQKNNQPYGVEPFTVVIQ